MFIFLAVKVCCIPVTIVDCHLLLFLFVSSPWMNWNDVIDAIDIECGKIGVGGLDGVVDEALGGLGAGALGQDVLG